MAEGIVIGNLTIPVIKGDKGDKGNTGEIISISLVLLSPSSTAYAINNGSTTQAQIELGIPKGLSVSTTNINASGELVFTFNDNSTVNVGKVVGKGISEVTVTDDFDFVVTYTDGTSVTACNLEDEVLGTINDILESYYTKTEIDNKGFITKEVNNLTNYTLKTNTGSSIELSINNSTYVMTLNLKNSAGTVISTGTVDLPLETMVVGATYDNTNKKIVLTLKNGSTIDVPVGDLVSGLQSEINSNNKLSSDLVDDTNHTNKFVTASEKEQITTNATDISNIKDGTSIDSFGDVETALSGKEDSSNKTGVLNSSSTTAQYPHAKAVYDELVERDEEIEALYNDHPDITDTGTDLTLNGTGDLKMKVDVGGNSTQVQYEGYNLLPILNTSQTIDGVTFTINDDKTVLVNGTASGNINFILSNIDISLEGNENYTLTGCPSGGSSTSYALWINSAGSLVDFGNGVTQTIASEGRTANGIIKIKSGTVCNNLLFKPMITKGTDLTKTYEPFVGNQASPNPTYKQDINNVEGDVVVISKNSDNTKSNSVTFPLSQGQKLMLGDTLEDDGIHHKRERKRINSTNFNINMSVNNKVCYIKNLDYSNFYNTSGLCTHFTNANVSYLPDNNAAEQNLNDNQFNFRTGTIDRVYFKNSNFTSLADWTNFFNNNEVYLEYELEEETIEPYTSAQQTAYNKLKEMQSYYDLTYVVGTSDNAQPILTAHAKKSLKVMQSEIDELKQAILNS